MRIGLCAVLLLTTGGMIGAVQADGTTSPLTADQAIACIQAAVSAQAGWVKEVEVEDEVGQQPCEVKLVDATGKRYTLHVDVTTNQVVKIK